MPTRQDTTGIGFGMIRYRLKCEQGHEFESWFQSASAFDDLSGRGLLSCAMCGSDEVAKAVMAPCLSSKQPIDQNPSPQTQPLATAANGALSAPDDKVQEMIQAMRKHIEENSTYVGTNFAAEARAIHDGSAPERMIHGETAPEEARALIEEGVKIAPLPFLPKFKTN